VDPEAPDVDAVMGQAIQPGLESGNIEFKPVVDQLTQPLAGHAQAPVAAAGGREASLAQTSCSSLQIARGSNRIGLGSMALPGLRTL
jgi:hypothetical protein